MSAGVVAYVLFLVPRPVAEPEGRKADESEYVLRCLVSCRARQRSADAGEYSEDVCCLLHGGFSVRSTIS